MLLPHIPSKRTDTSPSKQSLYCLFMATACKLYPWWPLDCGATDYWLGPDFYCDKNDGKWAYHVLARWACMSCVIEFGSIIAKWEMQLAMGARIFWWYCAYVELETVVATLQINGEVTFQSNWCTIHINILVLTTATDHLNQGFWIHMWSISIIKLAILMHVLFSRCNSGHWWHDNDWSNV